MAGSGNKATTQLNAGTQSTYSLIYTVPTGYYGVYNISFTNTTSSAATIRLYIGASTASVQVASEAYEYLTTVVGYGVFERTGIVMAAGANIVASSSVAGINVNVYGIETSTS
jgi:hypothetical protein